MDMNGVLNIMNGGEPPVLSLVAAATALGEDLENKQGVLKFSNGFKIQWNTVDVPSDAATEFELPEAYTEAHYNVIGCYAEALSGSVNQSSVHAVVAATSNILTHVNIFQIINGGRNVTYISWGKDAV